MRSIVRMVEAKPKVSSRSLSNNVDSSEKLNLPFVNEVLYPTTSEKRIFEDSRDEPPMYSKGKLRLRNKQESQETEPPRKKQIRKRKRKSRRKDNSSQSASLEKRKPFDIVVHIKVNE
ncbi:hypothetical protein MSG28_014278 [Choristoneura fumiferana]|uniref:Uncharacterized protein n=1 Tax=Choristoneura fumiferana TaxID=7141 RepID=A0ACC0JGP1_CHOFU|nr:hypothetical protein MSG28_014278 [Choristoneura fumiferana]